MGRMLEEDRPRILGRIRVPRTKDRVASDRRKQPWPLIRQRSFRWQGPECQSACPRLGRWARCLCLPIAFRDIRGHRADEDRQRRCCECFQLSSFANGSDPLFVEFIGAGPGQGDCPELQLCRDCLRINKVHAYAVHGDAVEGFVKGGDQADDLKLVLLSEDMKCPGAVLSRTPREKCLGLQFGVASV